MLALGENRQTLADELAEVEQSSRDSQARLQNANDRGGVLAEREAGLKARQHDLLNAVESARLEFEADREFYQSTTIEVQSQRSSRDSATTTLERALSQRKQLLERVESLTNHIEKSTEPLSDLQDKLQEQLGMKVAVDEELRGRHEALECANDELRTHEERRIEQDNLVNEARERVDSHRMVVRELEIRREGVAEKFAETGSPPPAPAPRRRRRAMAARGRNGPR